MEEERFTCVVCERRKPFTNYYVLRKEVFPHQTEYHSIRVCLDCARGLDRAVELKERELLRKYPEIYKEAFLEYKMRRR